MRGLFRGGLLAVAFGLALSLAADTISLFDGFISPPKANYPSMWVFNLGEESPRDVITHDLEEFTKVGISSFMLIGNGGALSHDKPYGDTVLKGKMQGVRADRLRWALHEANRLGLEVWIMLGPGGCGNSECPPEHAQKHLELTTVLAKTDADGIISVALPKKGPKETPRNYDGSPKYYWDVATLAIPENTGFLKTNDVIDVSRYLDSVSGSFSWKAPTSGNWTIIRAGFVPMMFGFAGCFIDHMSKVAFDKHWDLVMQPLLDAVAPDERAALKGVWCDSWEAGTINWTWDFAEEFRRRRGYDFLPMLPVKAGLKMISDEASRQFLRDWDVTIGELIADNHYAYQKEVANRHGLLSSAEGCGPHLHHGDARMIQGRCDVAMGEFWMPSPHRSEDSQRFMLRDSATAAHVYGIGIVEGESFSTMGTHWEESPAMFKPCADRAFCDGLTRICHHGMLMSVLPDVLPGDTRRAGSYYSPKVTWWKYSAPMNLYFARCSWMLSRGCFSADCLLYAGDAIDLFLGMKRPDVGFGYGYDYDLCPTEILLRAQVDNGLIVLPSGMRYKAIFLSDLNPACARMAPGRLPTIEQPLPPVSHWIPKCASDKLVQLEGNGARILRTRAEMKRFLDEGSLPPDFAIEEGECRSSIDWIHRIIPEGDVYFLSNQTNLTLDVAAVFRQSGYARVECWDAVTGQRMLANADSFGGMSRVHLRLPPQGSTFVVFLNKDAASRLSPPMEEKTCRLSYELSSSWLVSFDKKWGGPEKPVVFPSLVDWTKHEDLNIRHYSGTAIYRQIFDSPIGCPIGSPVTIDLGELRDVAHVSLNGESIGIAWTPPYAVVAPELKATNNVLEIEIVNLWINRLIGDAALPPNKRFANMNKSENPFRKDHPLMPSGLYGPVRIIWDDGPMATRRDDVLSNIQALSAQHGKMLSGQQCEPWPKIAQTRLGDLEKVYAKTGKWPAIGGFEYCEVKGSMTKPAFFKPPRWREVNPFIKEWAEKGGLVTISAHLPNPWTGGSAWDTSERSRLSELCLPDSASRRAYWRMVEGIADGLEDLQRMGIVVLWRPFHEMEGGWFWWGEDGGDGSRAVVMKRLWREMHEYMTEKRRLDNLIWVFNGKSCHYPGDDVVDLNSADIYSNNVGECISKLVPALASNDKKPFALAEFGPSWQRGQRERYDFSGFADEVLAAAPNCAYFLCWVGPWSLWHNDNADKLMSDPRIVTLEELNTGEAAVSGRAMK